MQALSIYFPFSEVKSSSLAVEKENRGVPGLPFYILVGLPKKSLGIHKA